jgi:mRNA interferase YafQ
MRTPVFTKKFEKELEKCKKRGLKIEEIREIMKRIVQDIPLEIRNKNHPLSGDYIGCFECHIKPDWLLIYMLDNEANTVTFLRTGTHSDLF